MTDPGNGRIRGLCKTWILEVSGIFSPSKTNVFDFLEKSLTSARHLVRQLDILWRFRHWATLSPFLFDATPVQIAEIFESIQGEGPWAGAQSLFIRTSGCNLRCWFCDTPYTSWKPEGSAWSLDELRCRVADSSAPDVVLTGGEPMLLSEEKEKGSGA